MRWSRIQKGSGIETTTGPLGQGLANSVGLALAEEIYRAKFGSKIIIIKPMYCQRWWYDGGDSHEALSLAGHLKLESNSFFDNNKISIDGSTSLSVSDDYKRFSSYGWDFIEINGHNEKQIFNAIKKLINQKNQFNIL